MAGTGNLAKFLKIFGILYFASNALISAVIYIMSIYSSGKYLQFSPGWIFQLFPAIGMLSGYWIYSGKYGWARNLIIAVSMTCSAVFLFIAFVAGPQMEKLNAEQAKKMHVGQQKLLKEKSERMLIDVGTFGTSIASIDSTSQKRISSNLETMSDKAKRSKGFVGYSHISGNWHSFLGEAD